VLCRPHCIPLILPNPPTPPPRNAVDCTTNPSLVYKAVQQPEYQRFLTDALAARGKAKAKADPNRPFAGALHPASWLIMLLLGRNAPPFAAGLAR